MTFIALKKMVIEKKYVYENGIICVTLPIEQTSRIYSATERFLKKTMEERLQNGNSNKTRTIGKEQILHR